MQFDLDEALIDQILFSMEDQDNIFFVDVYKGTVVNQSEIDESLEKEKNVDQDSERYVSIPQWDSSSGYRLMEKFTAGLRNPVLKEALTQALDRGKGVFRAFKDVLVQYPAVERLWYSFKEREMRKEIYSWYNALREQWGLERIGEEPEETEDLVFEDFHFRQATSMDIEKAQELHKQCVQELAKAYNQEQSKTISEADIADQSHNWFFPGDRSVIVETIKGDFAGYISSKKIDNCIRIGSLEVSPEYRGLGLGEMLLETLICEEKSTSANIFIDLPSAFQGFSRVLERNDFTPYQTSYMLVHTKKHKENSPVSKINK
jgi:ribosomal protein S18 acetylase RimI-like enzyme